MRTLRLGVKQVCAFAEVPLSAGAAVDAIADMYGRGLCYLLFAAPPTSTQYALRALS